MYAVFTVVCTYNYLVNDEINAHCVSIHWNIPSVSICLFKLNVFKILRNPGHSL